MKKILVCGRNFHARQLLRKLRQSKENIMIGVIDFVNDIDGSIFMGLPIVDYDDVSSTDFDEIAMAGRYAPEMRARLVERGVPTCLIEEYPREMYALEGEELGKRSIRTWALIDEFLEFSSRYAFDYWFVAGALLAIKRHQDFAWFADVDIAIPNEQLANLTNAFEEFFKHRRVSVMFSCNGDESNLLNKSQFVSQIVLSTACDLTHGEPPVIDIHSLRREEQGVMMSVGASIFIRSRSLYFNSLEMISVNGRQLQIPMSSEEYLEELYGVNWRTPARKFYVAGHLTRDTFR